MVSLSLEQANSQRPNTVFIRLCVIIVKLLMRKIMLINTSFVCYSDHVGSILLLGLHSVNTLLHKATVASVDCVRCLTNYSMNWVTFSMSAARSSNIYPLAKWHLARNVFLDLSTH